MIALADIVLNWQEASQAMGAAAFALAAIHGGAYLLGLIDSMAKRNGWFRSGRRS